MADRRPTAKRREMEWFTGKTGFAGLTTASLTNFTLFNAISVGARFIKGTTITRILMDLTFRSPSVAQNNEASYGVLIMNADARAAGAFPNPDDVSDRAGWMFRGRGQNITSSVSDGSQWTRLTHDNRSQRVLRTEEDELQFVIETPATGFTIEWSLYVRVLVKWP